MKHVSLSVIIPVYNVEEYLERCLDSIINQSYQEMEIILVNDGSTDKSGEICARYAKTDARIQLVNKENGGLSSARNTGIEIANGDYLTFVDSDDYIDLNTYADNMPFLMENRYIEILQYPFKRDNVLLGAPDKPYLVSGEKDLFANWWTNDVITSSVCNKIFRKEVFDTIKFPLGQTFEDHFLIVDFSENVANVYMSNKGCYYYMIRNHSITTSEVTFDKCIDFFKAHIKVYEKFHSYEELRPYRIIAFSRVYRKLITARRIDREANLNDFIRQLEEYLPAWSDIFNSRSKIKERLWFICIKILGVKHFMNIYTTYLNIKKKEITF